jgi:ribosomal protein L37AE/L43A
MFNCFTKRPPLWWHWQGPPEQVHHAVLPNSVLDYAVQEDEEISEAEYERLCQEHGGILDTVEYREKLVKRSEIRRQLEELRPLCPECQTPMVERSGRYGDFWGCPRYPKCKGTRKLTASVKAERRELLKQFEEYLGL